MIEAKTIIVGAALASFVAAFIVLVSVQAFCCFRRIGMMMVIIAAAFLHSMATKPTPATVNRIPMRLNNVTTTSITFDYLAKTNDVGKTFQMKYYEKGSDTKTMVGDPFTISTRWQSKTYNGNFVHSGRILNFVLEEVEDEEE